MRIGLVGDYNPDVTAHRAIPAAVEIASTDLGCPASISWVYSQEIPNVELREFSGFWCIPASPYREKGNVLDVIAFARRNNIPFLGTCGGYQHAALEFARNELGYVGADNSEENPETRMPLISALTCRLRNEAAKIILNRDSKLFQIYGGDVVSETYNCGFGVNPDYLDIFCGSDMQFTGFDVDGDPRALELKCNNFFVGTAFQPERSAFLGKPHPIIKSFLRAASNAYQKHTAGFA